MVYARAVCILLECNLVTCVCHSFCSQVGCGIPTHPQGADVPPQQTPPRQTPSQVDTPQEADIPQVDTPLGRHTPQADTPQADTPQSRHPPGQTTPLGRHPPPGRHPQSRRPPQEQTHPPQSMLGDMVNARVVHILLECNLVIVPITYTDTIHNLFTTPFCSLFTPPQTAPLGKHPPG